MNKKFNKILKNISIGFFSFIIMLMLSSCGKQKIDTSLNGTWESLPQQQSNAQNLLQSQNSSTTTQSTFVVEFNNENIQMSQVESSGMFSANRELAVGTYQIEKGVSTFKVTQDTCASLAGVDGSESKTLTFSYSVLYNVKMPNTNLTANQLTITFSTGQVYTLYQQQTNEQLQSVQNLLSSSQLGCFVQNGSATTFVPNSLKPRN